MTSASTEKDKKSCFVIAPIGAADSDTRKRSDKVLRHIFRSALEEKYIVTRADEIDEAGMITSQILRAVQDSHLVVADLTETNPNVLYELAVRHAIEKPVIHVIEPRLSKIPFDIAGFRTIEFDITDPDSIADAVEKLRKQAEQAESGKWGDTPIKLANVMRTSKEDAPQMLLLKQAVEGIANVSARLAKNQDAEARAADLAVRLDDMNARLAAELDANRREMEVSRHRTVEEMRRAEAAGRALQLDGQDKISRLLERIREEMQTQVRAGKPKPPSAV